MGTSPALMPLSSTIRHLQNAECIILSYHKHRLELRFAFYYCGSSCDKRKKYKTGQESYYSWCINFLVKVLRSQLNL